MNTLLEAMLTRERLILSTALLLAAAGILAWFEMPRQEDPSMPDRFGIVTCAYPGADAATVERLVTDPIEEALTQVKEVNQVFSTSRTDVVVIRVRLGDAVYETTEAWDEVRLALAEAAKELPEGALEPELQTGFIVDQEMVVAAVTGSLDRRQLLDVARDIKRELLTVDGIAKVLTTADPEEQVIIEYDDSQARRLGLPATALVTQLQVRNTSLPGGVIRVDGKATSVRALADFQNLDDLKQTEIRLPTGATVPLSSVATVRLGPAEPAPDRMRFNGAEAVGLSAVPKPKLNIVELGARVRARLEALRERHAPTQIEILSFQPDYVADRLADLGGSLLLGITIVAIVLVFSMGIRLGLVVSSVVPLVAMSALGVFATAGGILHQISVSALIIALGMLVDNAIVVSENIQQRLDDGVTRLDAAMSAVRELAFPLSTATATTLAAFVPMYASAGPTADFTRSIPQVIMLTLTISYVFAMTVTPVLGVLFLRPKKTPGTGRLTRITDWAGRVATGRPWRVTATAILVVLASGFAAGFVDKSFFPAAGRNQFVIEQVMPEGTHLDQTDKTSRQLEQFLLDRNEVVQVSSFMGRSAPKFYYNLPRRPNSPHFANLIVQTRTPAEVPVMMAAVRRYAATEIPAADVIPRELEQGPPIDAPIEIRMQGKDLERLYQGAETVMATLREIPLALHVRHNQGLGVPAIELAINDGAAGRRGLARRDIALAVLGQTRGLLAGQLRNGEDPIPILVRGKEGEALSPNRLPGVAVASEQAGMVPLAQLAEVDVLWKPAAIHRRDRIREITVSAQLAKGASYSTVLAAFQARFDETQLPEGVELFYGGAAEGSGDANASLAAAAPMGAVLLLFFLMVEFNSFRRVALILTTVPLAAAGIVPGLLIGDQPFGFMSLLGVIALIGVVVNNAIVLLDVIESGRQVGLPVHRAVARSIGLRARPILLTTATTVAGLTPLALSTSPLWPPLASAMIAGLIASTFLTLMVVPALYTLLFRDPSEPTPHPSPARSMSAAAAVALIALASGSAYAAPVSLSAAMDAARQRPSVTAANAQADAAQAQADAEWRQAYLPTVGAEASLNSYDRQLQLGLPAGLLPPDIPVTTIPFGERSFYQVGARVTQPILDPSRLFGQAPSAELDAQGARLAAQRSAQERAAEAAERFLDVKALEAAVRATEAFIESLEAQSKQLTALAREGRALEVDRLRVDLALADAQQERLRLNARRQVALRAFGQSIGRDGAEEPGEVDRRFEIPALEQALENGGELRDDVTALERQAKAATSREDAVWWELVPRLEARGEIVASDGFPYTTEYYLLGSVNLVWLPFVSATRFARADAAGADAERLTAQRTEAERGVRVAIASAYADLEIAQGELEVSRRGVEQAEDAVAVERARYEAGRVVVSELLEAEAILRERRTRRDVATLDLTRARIRVRLAVGTLD